MKQINFNKFMAIAALATLFQSCHAFGETESGHTSITDKNWQLRELTVNPGVDWDRVLIDNRWH